MKKNFLIFIALAAMFIASCTDKKGAKDEVVTDKTETVVNDTTVYGVCGESTTMSYLELDTSDGDTIRYLIQSDSIYSPVKGGLLVGDRLAVTGHKDGDEFVADNVINLTTLLGKWSSIDKNFEIKEGGVVKSTLTEHNQYVSWEIINGNLVLAPDTFSVFVLGPDTLMLENKEGIFAFARVK